MIKYLIGGVVIYYFLNNYGITIKTSKPIVNELLNLPAQISLRDLAFGSFKKQNQLIQIYISQIQNKKNGNFLYR
ncbi:MAG TPA: hypothetical protein ENI76_06035 [Ignavibacteria bacterium]|nr:hypothetical protein [Ignavibacteria bacterium]